MILEIQTYDEAWQQNEMKELQTHEKMIWLKCKLEKETPNLTLGSNSITVNRNQLLTDSMKAFDGILDHKKDLKVNFEGEIGQDQGGISREFFTSIMKELLNENL